MTCVYTVALAFLFYWTFTSLPHAAAFLLCLWLEVTNPAGKPRD